MKGGKGKARSGKTRKDPASRSLRAGLTFPVGRILTYLKNRTGMRVSVEASIALAATLEHLICEILEGAIVITKREKFSRIKPKFIKEVFIKDDEFFEIYQRMNLTIGLTHRPKKRYNRGDQTQKA